jgi:phosphoribosylformylglycinamidine synthase
LNFGNPYDPQVYYQFVNAIKGMGEACKKFDAPVTGGNVSFYNQHPEGAVYPTPTIGMVGVLNSVEDKMTLGFKQSGDLIYLIGQSRNDIHSSEYLHKYVGVEFSPAPHFDLDEEHAFQQVILQLISSKQVNSVHDISEGGLFITLLESGFVGSLGFEVAQQNTEVRADAYWFGEAQSRAVVSVGKEKQASFEQHLSSVGIAHELLGSTSGNDVKVNGENWGSLEQWKNAYDEAITAIMTK